jgi:hypothetical protein
MVWIFGRCPGGYFGDLKDQRCGNRRMLMLAVVPFSSVKHIACGEEECYGNNKFIEIFAKRIVVIAFSRNYKRKYVQHRWLVL